MIYLNKKPLQLMKFPNGETKLNVQLYSRYTPNIIDFHYEDDLDIMNLFFLGNHLHAVGCNDTILNLNYIPYSRMDRVHDRETEVFTLKYFCNLVNDLMFDRVIVTTPHSDVAVGFLNRCEIKDLTLQIFDYIMANKIIQADAVFYPDFGANKKYQNAIKMPTLIGIKNRDWETGQILSLDIHGTPPKDNFDVVILDDLCAYGGSFYHSALALKQLGANNIYLIITHCENSVLDLEKGSLNKTDNPITKIFTTDSIFTGIHDKIVVYKEDDLLEKF